MEVAGALFAACIAASVILFVTLHNQHRLSFGIDDSLFKRIRIRKCGFLFRAIGGNSVQTHGVTVPLFLCQLSAYLISAALPIAALVLCMQGYTMIAVVRLALCGIGAQLALFGLTVAAMCCVSTARAAHRNNVRLGFCGAYPYRRLRRDFGFLRKFGYRFAYRLLHYRSPCVVFRRKSAYISAYFDAAARRLHVHEHADDEDLLGTSVLPDDWEIGLKEEYASQFLAARAIVETRLERR